MEIALATDASAASPDFTDVRPGIPVFQNDGCGKHRAENQRDLHRAVDRSRPNRKTDPAMSEIRVTSGMIVSRYEGS